ncbi:MAG: preprotein translocase subunit YajC [Ndongobacter sp.]|nr:preprotein translocase subunit YajC [Ndongobacter sp.]
MPQGMESMFLLLGLFGVMYFLMIRPQKKKQEQERKMRSEMKVGDQIVTIGGIRGRVTDIREDSFEIETGGDHLRIEFLKQALSYVVRPVPGTEFAEKERFEYEASDNEGDENAAFGKEEPEDEN